MKSQIVDGMASWFNGLRQRFFPPLTEEQADLLKRLKFPCC